MVWKDFCIFPCLSLKHRDKFSSYIFYILILAVLLTLVLHVFYGNYLGGMDSLSSFEPNEQKKLQDFGNISATTFLNTFRINQ